MVSATIDTPTPPEDLPKRVYGTAALHACQPEPEPVPAAEDDDAGA